MKHCLHCKWAKWQRTKVGRFHPSGDGRCTFVYKAPPIPQAFYWIGSLPQPTGGYINRKKELKDHCVYFSRREIPDGLIDA